jgi:hypothetical protein
MARYSDNGKRIGRPPSHTPDSLGKAYDEYMAQCKEDKVLLPNIAGLCLYAGIARETFYCYKEDRAFNDTIKNIENGLEDAALQCKDAAKSIFYLKNKFGYRDKIEQELSGKVEQGLSDADRALLNKVADRINDK